MKAISKEKPDLSESRRQIPVSLLREGLVYSEPVYIEGESLLVPAGIAIRKKDIEHLVAWEIESVYTDGEPVLPPGSDTEGMPEPGEKKSPPPPSPLFPVNTENYRTYLDLIRRLNSVFADISGGGRAEAHSLDSIAGDLFQAVLKEQGIMIGYILGGEVKGHEMAKNSINTAILSTLISVGFKFTNYRIMQIVIGALLHDVGMLRLPREIAAKRGGLSAEELRQMHTHPSLAYQLVSKELRYPEEVGAIVYQHHEHWDGQGYPRRLAGAAIDTGARIVAVADAFEAMVSQKPYRNSMAGYQAMKNLLADNSRCFDPEILKVFIKAMGIYPIGSLVLLNNGVTARVVDVQGDSPLRPKIRPLFDESGTPYPQNEGGIIDLLGEKRLFIARALEPREIAKKNG